MTEQTETEAPKSATPTEHFKMGEDALRAAMEAVDDNLKREEIPDPLTLALLSCAHGLLGGLRMELDYQAERRLSRATPPRYGEPTFEEDDDRP
jgi:hypothetical protein